MAQPASGHLASARHHTSCREREGGNPRLTTRSSHHSRPFFSKTRNSRPELVRTCSSFLHARASEVAVCAQQTGREARSHAQHRSTISELQRRLRPACECRPFKRTTSRSGGRTSPSLGLSLPQGPVGGSYFICAKIAARTRPLGVKLALWSGRVAIAVAALGLSAEAESL